MTISQNTRADWREYARKAAIHPYRTELDETLAVHVLELLKALDEEERHAVENGKALVAEKARTHRVRETRDGTGDGA